VSEEAAPPPAASETDQTTEAEAPAGGAVVDGGGGGTDSTVTVESLTAEREKLNATNRDLQSAKDRTAAELAKAQAELAKLKGGGNEATQSAPLDTRAFYAEVAKFGQLDSTAKSLKDAGKYEYADEAIYAKATEYDSVEALEAALKASHDAKAAVIEAAVEAKVAAKLAEAEGKYGVKLNAPATAAAPPAGEPSVDQWASMSMDEQDAWEAKVPGITDRMIRSAYQGV